jgi:hypothetical protein
MRNIVKLLTSNQHAGKLLKIPEKALDIMQFTVEKGHSAFLDLFGRNFNKILIEQINRGTTKRDANVQKIEKVYQRI